MPQISLRLEDHDHQLLQLACMLTKKSQNTLITELVQAEIDRVLPGKRQAMHSDPQALWKVLGVPAPEPGPMAKRWSAELMSQLQEDGTEGRTERRAA